mmetsp:Transcript_24307/g.34316  ORF Transcript_24307/g.34316 Transcript_24307/m.34316 type:complete len:143 (-) Transcript_24307:319-747(-)
MKEEVENASRWWMDQLEKSISNKHVLESFQKCLAQEMIAKYTGHWYENDIGRGSGFRSVSYDNRLDPMLCRASKGAGIDTIEKHLEHARNQIMFVNPGEVKLANAALLSAPATCIFRKGDPNLTGSNAPNRPNPDFKSNSSS